MSLMSRKELLILLTLAFVQFSNILDAMIMMPLAPTFKDVFDIDTRHFGWLVSSFGLAAGCSAFFSTFWADKFDRKKILIILYIGFILGTFFCAISPTYNILLISRIFTGLFGGVCGSVILAIVGDIIPNERRGQAMGIVMVGFALASIVGVPLGLVIANAFNWQMPFYVICALGFIILMCIILIVPNVTKHILQESKSNTLGFYKTIFTNSNMRIALLLPIVMVVGHMAIIPYITDYSVNNLKFSIKTEVPPMYLIGGILSVITSPIIGKLADRFGRYKIFTVLSCLAIVPLYLIPNLESHNLLYFYFASSLFFVGSGGRMIPVQAIVTSAVLPQYRGSFMGLNAALQQFTLGIITLAGGFIITNNDKGELQNYPIVGYIAICATLLTLVIAKRVKAV